jgi:hypothetical protein
MVRGMLRIRFQHALVAIGAAFWPHAAAAQEHVTIRSDLFFYGDNTEFHNPFRRGETIFGAALRVAADIDVNDRVLISLGGFGNQRFGSEQAFELVRPIIALTVRGRRSVFSFGTFPTRSNSLEVGPDRQGPHALLPPLQRETLAFDRPYEAGLQWTFAGPALRQDLWLAWQRLNTPAHRERFDGGLNTEWRAASLVAFPAHIHVVHEGGQLFGTGVVRDSAAAAAGVKLGSRGGDAARVSLETYGLISRFVPDRASPSLTRDGVGFFGRAAVERAGWRGHVVMWRGRNVITDEGDPNYLSITHGGDRYKGTRDYAEAGLARRFQLAPSAWFEVSGRLHRIEHFYEYSYRVLSAVSLRWPVK